MAGYTDPKMYIAGEWCSSGDGRSEAINDPATENNIGRLPIATPADLDRALEAAHASFPLWKAETPRARGVKLHRVAELLRERAGQIGEIMVLEQGKVLAQAITEVRTAADHFDWMAEEAKRAYGRIIPSTTPGNRQSVLLEPVGPVAAFTPWNFPATAPARKLSTALAAGCSIILKASEETPGTAVEIVRACADAGIPAGVVNLVFGVPAQVSEHLIRSPVIRKVSFTGSIAVGKRLASLAAEGLKTCTMELGGHAPVLVFEDADWEQAVSITVQGKFRNAGQVCVSPTRFFVHESHYEAFVKSFADQSRKVIVGPGHDPKSEMGPLNNARRLEAMEAITADVRARGGKVVTGGSRVGNRGYFWAPTVFTDVPAEALVMTSEPFGPVAPIAPFRTFEEAIGRANELQYGLAAYAFTRSARIASAVAHTLQSGMVAINNLTVSPPEAPIGGVKESGYGREGGVEGLLQYMNTKFVNEAFVG